MLFRRSDYDVFLEDSDEFSIGREYMDSFMGTPIDFVSVMVYIGKGGERLTASIDQF